MKNETMLPLALSYISRGWSVIPVGLDKKPLISWREYQDRIAKIEEIVKWFEKYPDAQIGIVTGDISNLTVIDIEDGGDFNLIKEETLTVKTGGGGIHIYLQYDKDFQNAVRLLPLVDIRSQGGYVVAPGSKTTKGDYVVIKDLPVVIMSETTKTKLISAKKTPYTYNEQTTQVPTEKINLLDYPGYGPGQRNDQMTKYIGSVLARTHPSIWDTIGWPIVLQANQRNSPPLAVREVRSTWESLKSRERRQNPSGRIWNQESNKQTSYGHSVANEDILKKEEVIDNDKSAKIMHASDVAEMQTIDTDHTYSIGMKPFDDALLGGFSAGDLVVVSGRSGVGKTSLILDWSMSLASGCNGSYKGLPTLWFSYEVLARPLWNKFENTGATKETPIYLPSFNESGDSEWVTSMIVKGIKEKGIKVVAIDHLGFLRPPRGSYSNGSDAITHTVRLLKHLAVDNGIIIILPVHVRKTNKREMDQDDVAESKGIVNESDSLFFIDRIKTSNGLLSEQAKVWLSKNRKTGISVAGIFDFKFGRYFYNDQATKHENSMEERKKEIDEAWDKY